MASIVSASVLAARFQPCLAIFQHDLRTLWQGKLVRLWLAATIIVTLLLAMGNWAKLPDAPAIAAVLFPYLVFPWFFVVIILGVTPVSAAQTEALADGILCRPIKRHGYLLATWAARVVTVLGVYLVVTVPAIAMITLGKRPVADDTVTFYGVITSLFLVGLVLTLIESLGFLAGTVLRKPLLAVVVLVFAWYPVNLVLSAFSLEEFSPISLNQAIPTQLGRTLLAKEDSPGAQANRADLESVTGVLSSFGKAFSTARPATPKDGFFETGKFEDFSLLRVTLGYAVPTLAAVALAAFSFYRRDL